MDGQRVLVTGGAGFIGSILANDLASTNEVVVVDDQSLGDSGTLRPDVEYHNRSVLEDDLPTDVDVVFHLAALSSITDHERDRDHLRTGIEVNVEGFANVVEQARASGCDTVVYASSSAVYGTRTEPVTEDVRLRADNAYAASKLAREHYAEFFETAYGMNMAGMRFFSVYRDPHDPDEGPREATNILTKLAAEIANGLSPEIFGDGTHKRDFIHVDDVVRGLELAAENDLFGKFNLGTGELHRINDIVAMLNDAFGTAVEPTYVDNPIPNHMFIEELVADPSKMHEATGWEPRIDIETGIRQIRDAFR